MKNSIVEKIGNKVTPVVGKASLAIEKSKPEIFLGLGIFAGVLCVGLSIYETFKAKPILDEHKERLEAAHAIEPEDQSKKKEVVKVYAKTSLDLGKVYAPAIACGTVSIVMILASHGEMSKRNAALETAYISLSEAYRGYREKVAKMLGEEKENEIYRNECTDESEENDANKKTNASDAYTRLFDESNPHWEKDPELNFMFLKGRQSCLNYRLRQYGYLKLNDVLESLGYEKTIAGEYLGWLYRPDDPNHIGDNYVDFGFMRANTQESRNFIEGTEPNVWLIFNVDDKPIINSLPFKKM